MIAGKFADQFRQEPRRPGTTMKRKRGPVLDERQGQAKRQTEEEVEDSDELNGDSSEDNDHFEGFSDGEEEEELEKQDEDKSKLSTTTVNGNSRKLKQRGKKAAPTQEELLESLFRSSSFQSNLFKLQVDELLSEVRVKYDKMEKVEKVLHRLKDIFTSIPESQEQLLHAYEASLKLDHHIRVPFPTPPPPKDALYKFKFQKPTSVKLVGSYGLKAAAKHPDGITIDVSVTMPDAIFQEKDYLDHRYFYKRSCYIASLAAAIKSSKLEVFLSFENLHGDQRLPVLILSSLKDGSENDFSKTHARIRVLPSISRNLFPLSKLSPTRCNIRASPTTPTPLYNASILSDTTHFHFLTQLYNSSQSCATFIDASLLGRVWLRQRGFTGSYCDGGFGAFEWTWFTSHLLRGGGPNGRNGLDANFSSFQLFRGALNSLALQERVVGDDVQCIDVETGVNVFSKMTLASYKMLQHEASNTLKILSESKDDVFQAIFLTKVDNPLLHYDIATRISLPPLPDKDVDSPSPAFSSIKATNSILQRALTSRVNNISITASDKTSFSITSTKPSEPVTLTIGLLIDPEQSRRLVDHGPPASDTTGATAFRAFWGEKAELRRFKDGSILESVVWNCKTLEDRYGIVKRIVRFVIARHISAGVAGDIMFLTPSLYPEIAAPPEVISTYSKAEGDAFHSLSDAFEHLVRQLKDLKEMPLAISLVVPVSEGLTHTSVYPPHPQNFARLSTQQGGSYYVPVNDVVLQLEGSGKWPDDLRAIQKVKIGLLLHIARQLETFHSISANVGLENTDIDISKTGFLDVIYEHGYAFRIRIQHDPNHREATLIERLLKNKMLSHQDRTQYDAALKIYRDKYIRGTAHAQALHTLQGKYFYLPNTIRLVKRWFSAHMLSQQISTRAIELIVCYVFLCPRPWTASASAEVGFLRTLKFLQTWDWHREPLVVDFDGSMTRDQHGELVKEFEATRKQDPGIAHAAWSIYTSYDASGSCWTKERPGKAVAARVTALARSSLDVLSKDSGNVKQIFTTPLTGYDILIQGKKDYSVNVKGFKNLSAKTWKTILIDFDPMQKFLADLESCFGDAILWFYDRTGGSVIAGLWNPHVVASRQWKINLGYSTIPLGDSAKDNKSLVSLNKQSIINEIGRIGGGLISNITVKSVDT